MAARSGHGDFADYHERFNHQVALLTCCCATRKSSEHFLQSPRVRARARFRTPLREGARWALGTAKGTSRFRIWTQETSFFTDICSNKQAAGPRGP